MTNKHTNKPAQSAENSLQRQPVTPRNQYNHARPGTDNQEPSLTKQSFRDETNINNIMARYVKTGIIEHINSLPGTFGFVPNIDFREAQEIVLEGQKKFAELPAIIREKFNHNPAEFVEFCLNPTSTPDLAAMGLLDEAATLAHKRASDALNGEIPASALNRALDSAPKPVESAPDQLPT